MEIGIMNENGTGGEWFEELPRTGRIYQLMDEVQLSERKDTRIQALKALGESGDPRAVRPLIECAGDEEAEIRKYATEGLFKLHSPRGVDALNARLTDKQEEGATRRMAAEAMMEIRSQHAVELLISCLLDREENLPIREYVAILLARIKSDKALHALQRCSGEDSEMGAIAENALKKYATTSSNNLQGSWSIRNSTSENHTVKEGAAFRR
jgi:HEAT repeat protein